MTQRFYTTYGLVCDRCGMGTPYFATHDAMLQWLYLHGWDHYEGVTLCDQCVKEESDYERI
jgi:hypothetical protein